MMYTTDTPTTNLNWKDTLGEVIELICAILEFDLKGIRNELCDVYTCSMCAITTSTGVRMPIYWMRSAREWDKRMVFFTKYLRELGLAFKVEYLRFGANYKKDHKRRMVVRLAVRDQLNRCLDEYDC